MFDPSPHVDWVLAAGRMLDRQGLVDGLGKRLRADGVAMMRVRLSFRTTHPLTTALSVIWEANTAQIRPFSAAWA